MIKYIIPILLTVAAIISFLWGYYFNKRQDERANGALTLSLMFALVGLGALLQILGTF